MSISLRCQHPRERRPKQLFLYPEYTRTMATQDIILSTETQEKYEDVMLLNESVDMKALRIIRDNFQEVYNRLGKEFYDFNATTGEWNEVDYKTAYTIINKFHTRKEFTLDVPYKYGSKLKSGRRFALNSLQCLCKPLRHAISKDLYYDVDMKNAHPTFLLNLTKHLKFEHPILTQYIAHRDELLTKWVGTTGIYNYNKKTKKMEHTTLQSADNVKKYFLTILNGGGSNKTSCTELNTFYDKHQEFLDIFYKANDYSKYKFRADKKYQRITDTTKKDNRKGTCLNYYLCDVENEALGWIERYLTEHNIKYGTLCFDGLMIYIKDVKNIQELLQQLEQVLITNMKFSILLAVKPMTNGVNISDLEERPDVELDEQAYATHLLEVLKPNIKHDSYLHKLYMYDESTALWVLRQRSHIRTHITDVLDVYVDPHPNPKDRDTAYQGLRTNSTQNNILAIIGPYIDMIDDSEFIHDNFDCSKGLLPIADNKVIDFKTNTVRDRLKTDYFTKTTDNVLENVSAEDHAIVMDYFYKWLNTNDLLYVECLLKALGYIFAGETYLKAIFNFIGGQDGGKSTFIDMIGSMLGPFYGVANDRVFIDQKNKAVHDTEVFNLIGKRLTTLSETKKEQSYNTTLMKRISGQDTIDIRRAGEPESRKIFIKSILAVVSNFVAKYKDDVPFASRQWGFNFSSTFKRDDKFVITLKSRKNIIFSVICEYAHRFYKDGITKVEQVEKFTEAMNDDQCSIKRWCKTRKFVKTDDKKDIIDGSIIYDNYHEYCTEENIRDAYGRTTFYEKFEALYKLEKQVKGSKVVNNIKQQFRCYRFLIEEEDIEENTIVI